MSTTADRLTPSAQPGWMRSCAGVRALHGACEVITPPVEEAPLEDIARVHDPAYLAALEAFCKEGGGAVDADTYARPDSWRAARRAAGAGLAALAELEQTRRRGGLRAGTAPGTPRHDGSGHGLLPAQFDCYRGGLTHGTG